MSKNVRAQVSLNISKAMHTFMKGCKKIIKISYFFKFHCTFSCALNIIIYHELNKITVIVNALGIMLFDSWPQALVQRYVSLREHARGPIQRFYQNFTEVSLTSKLYYWSISKLWIYSDYMVAFVNSACMYYIKKLNNGEYPPNRKDLSVKYGFKCVKQPLNSLHCGYYVCEHLRTCGQ
jgi:hypothetical protein